jgi:hypothetical protein
MVAAAGRGDDALHRRRCERAMSVPAAAAADPLPGGAGTGPVDAVIAWVDGNDPAHRARLDACLHALGQPPRGGAAPTRFDDAGEIEYCIVSLLRFAPWLGRIHVVTAGQVPPVLPRLQAGAWGERIRLVDHAEIFAGYERFLPTFNSRAICSMLWRIDGLAERFLYLNDDFMLLRPIAQADFFGDDGTIVQRGQWRAQSARTFAGKARTALQRLRGAVGGEGAAPRDSERNAQELSARLAGFDDRYFRLGHTPYPFRRSTMQAFFEARPGLLERDLAYPFRRAGQFRAECVSAHLEIAQGKARFDRRLRLVQLKPAEQPAWRLRRKLRDADRDGISPDGRAAFACVQSLDLAPEALRADIVAWLRRRIGTLDQLPAVAT